MDSNGELRRSSDCPDPIVELAQAFRLLRAPDVIPSVGEMDLKEIRAQARRPDPPWHHYQQRGTSCARAGAWTAMCYFGRLAVDWSSPYEFEMAGGLDAPSVRVEELVRVFGMLDFVAADESHLLAEALPTLRPKEALAVAMPHPPGPEEWGTDGHCILIVRPAEETLSWDPFKVGGGLRQLPDGVVLGQAFARIRASSPSTGV